MPNFTVTIPVGLLNGLLDAFANTYPIPDDEEGAPLYTKAVWAKMRIRRYIRDIYSSQAAALAAETARTTAIETAETESEDLEVV